jgi:membrane protease YdiL (CAAX protease family)
MQPVAQTVDAASNHLYAFAFMVVLMLIFGVGRVAKEAKTSVKNWKSFLNFWMFAYVLLLGALMSVTTGMALVLLVNEKGEPRMNFIPPSMISIAAAVVGVFGFEFLFRKFIIGFGENKFDLETTLQNLVDQAVAATLKKEAGI